MLMLEKHLAIRIEIVFDNVLHLSTLVVIIFQEHDAPVQREVEHDSIV